MANFLKITERRGRNTGIGHEFGEIAERGRLISKIRHRGSVICATNALYEEGVS